MFQLPNTLKVTCQSPNSQENSMKLFMFVICFSWLKICRSFTWHFKNLSTSNYLPHLAALGQLQLAIFLSKWRPALHVLSDVLPPVQW